MNGLLEFAKIGKNITSISVVYNTTPEEAESIADKIARGNPIQREKIIISRIGPLLGVHLGPGSLIVAFLEAE